MGTEVTPTWKPEQLAAFLSDPITCEMELPDYTNTKVPESSSRLGKSQMGYYALAGIPCLGRHVTAGDAQQN